jgi:hypothetical protein
MFYVKIRTKVHRTYFSRRYVPERYVCITSVWERCSEDEAVE